MEERRDGDWTEPLHKGTPAFRKARKQVLFFCSTSLEVGLVTKGIVVYKGTSELFIHGAV
jgi:hypothetical protein